MADGFLGRWSQRKQATRDGRPLADSEPNLPSTVLPDAGASASHHGQVSRVPASVPEGSTGKMAQAMPAPTLEDVQAIKPNDSFARFVAPNVAPEVRNAAMKKLFTDPHYNVMDGLDIYIDDYSIPSHLPAATLRQMASAKFLNLLEEEGPKPLGEDVATDPVTCMAQSAPAPALPVTLTEDTTHDHIDLRLQPDHAAGCARLEREPE